MSELTQHLNGLEYQKERAEKEIEFSIKIERLLQNPDFREVIIDNYCSKAAAIFVHQSADPALTEKQQKDALSMAQSAGHLLRWFQVNGQQAELLKERIKEIDEEILEVRAEMASE